MTGGGAVVELVAMASLEAYTLHVGQGLHHVGGAPRSNCRAFLGSSQRRGRGGFGPQNGAVANLHRILDFEAEEKGTTKNFLAVRAIGERRIRRSMKRGVSGSGALEDKSVVACFATTMAELPTAHMDVRVAPS